MPKNINFDAGYLLFDITGIVLGSTIFIFSQT